MESYTNRRTNTLTVKSIKDGRLNLSDGWSHPMPPENGDRIKEGDTITVESRGTTDLGWMLDGEWLYRKSDEQVQQERIDMLARFDLERERALEKYRDDWARREAALPENIRLRLDYFREKAGKHHFEVNGWGYELMICELVVLYLASGLEDVPSIMEYAKENGASGNQHGCAKALASSLKSGHLVNLYGTVSGLVPLTGSVDYS